jgi:hypothetical protein
MVCSNEQIPSDFQRVVQVLITKSLPCGPKFSLPNCDGTLGESPPERPAGQVALARETKGL